MALEGSSSSMPSAEGERQQPISEASTNPTPCLQADVAAADTPQPTVGRYTLAESGFVPMAAPCNPRATLKEKLAEASQAVAVVPYEGRISVAKAVKARLLSVLGQQEEWLTAQPQATDAECLAQLRALEKEAGLKDLLSKAEQIQKQWAEEEALRATGRWVPLSHGNPEDMWQCDYCTAKFFSYGDTEKHEEICPDNPEVKQQREEEAAAWTVPTDYPTHVEANKYFQTCQSNRVESLEREALTAGGAEEEGFFWCQDSTSCTVTVPVPAGTKGHHVQVALSLRTVRQPDTGRKISVRRLQVLVQGKVLLEGDLAYVIVAPEEGEELDWELKDPSGGMEGRLLRVELLKKNHKTWTKLIRS